MAVPHSSTPREAGSPLQLRPWRVCHTGPTITAQLLYLPAAQLEQVSLSKPPFAHPHSGANRKLISPYEVIGHRNTRKLFVHQVYYGLGPENASLGFPTASGT